MADLLHVPELLLQKFPARAFTAEAALEFLPRQSGEQTGLIVVGRTCATLGLRQGAQGLELVLQVAQEDAWTSPLAGNSAKLRVTIHDGGACTFAYATSANPGAWTCVPVPFTAEPAEWIGARLGIYSLAPQAGTAGHADFDYFRFSSPI